MALSLESLLLSAFFWGIFGRSSFAYEGNVYPIFGAEFSVGVIGIYGIGRHASYPHIHELPLHADTVFQTYILIECFEREVFDERYAIYLYVIDLCTELDRLCFLVSYDGTYIMTDNADNTVTYFPSFQYFHFLYKNLSDDGKMLPVIPAISE